MQCPFPGMDPYIERPSIWADFHDCLIAAIRGALQPLLRPKYAALVQDRFYVVESERPIYPDVALVESRSPYSGVSSAAVLELDEPVVFEMAEEEIRQPYITIVEPAAGNRLVTAIEVLSPDNKAPGSGRKIISRSAKRSGAAAPTSSKSTCCAMANRRSASRRRRSRNCRLGITLSRSAVGRSARRFTQSLCRAACRALPFR